MASNRTWTKDKTYLLTQSLMVPAGITLTIEAGTLVQFKYLEVPPENRVYLRVDGALIASGTKSEPITFTSDQSIKQPNQYNYILFNNGSYGNFKYCIFEAGYAGIEFMMSSVQALIEHSIFRLNSIALDEVPNTVEVKNSQILNNGLAFWGNAYLHENLLALNERGIGNGNSGGAVYEHNTIVLNQGNGILFSTSPDTFSYNNLLGNLPYDARTDTCCTTIVPAIFNYWGTTQAGIIEDHILHKVDNFDYGEIQYSNFLTVPDIVAPGFLADLTISPESPIGVQQATFLLTFSRPMDQSANPIVTFGDTAPYTSFTVLDNAQWLDDHTWQATYDITSLVPRGTYFVSVSGAEGTDEVEIPVDTRYSFIVDYAGQITDQTPPDTPVVLAGGKENDPSTVEAMWFANDPDSMIIDYRYAIGSAPGSTDIVNWRITNSTSFTQSGLGLIEGRQYWVAVQARNTGGLWSDSGTNRFIAGQPIHKIFLPQIILTK